MKKLVRVCKAESLPISRSTLYKYRHMNKYPELFIKFGGALFVDLEVLEEILEKCRLK
jgi:hypothetical protein